VVSDAQKADNRLFVDVFATEQGKRVLEILRLETFEQAVFRHARDTKKGTQVFGPQDETLYAAWREGQNHLLRVILDRIECGRKGE